MTNNQLILVLLQVSLIIGLSRIIGNLFSRFKQPSVIGEIIAGIMLGPSLLGWCFPRFSPQLFPSESLPFLYLISQVGLIFFMFLVGLELNPQHLRGKIKTAIAVSNISIILPFILGVILSFIWLYPLNDNSQISLIAFALFIGSAMSITAFPVLARIITDNNLQNTPLGTLALTCASVDDIMAWSLLAVAIAVTRTNSILAAIPTILGISVYGFLMLTVGRKILKPITRQYKKTGQVSREILTLIYIGVLLSAVITDLIGIDVIFGGFLLGAIIPKNQGFIEELIQKTEDFVSTFMLPIFFAYSGLNTQIGLLNTPYLWLMTVVIILAAIIGKYFGAYGAARFWGVGNREASALGWLMNTRGLTELIILNVGLKLKVISPEIFTMFVIMALATTIMGSPLLEWTYPKHLIAGEVEK